MIRRVLTVGAGLAGGVYTTESILLLLEVQRRPFHLIEQTLKESRIKQHQPVSVTAPVQTFLVLLNRRRVLYQTTAQPSDRTSACSSTVRVALSCLSGG